LLEAFKRQASRKGIHEYLPRKLPKDQYHVTFDMKVAVVPDLAVFLKCGSSIARVPFSSLPYLFRVFSRSATKQHASLDTT